MLHLRARSISGCHSPCCVHPHPPPWEGSPGQTPSPMSQSSPRSLRHSSQAANGSCPGPASASHLCGEGAGLAVVGGYSPESARPGQVDKRTCGPTHRPAAWPARQGPGQGGRVGGSGSWSGGGSLASPTPLIARDLEAVGLPHTWTGCPYFLLSTWGHRELGVKPHSRRTGSIGLRVPTPLRV